jgi:predicted phage terminase large subunit-like protein
MALLEEKARRAARAKLLAFTQYTLPGYEAAALHRDISDGLEDVASGECDRLMIFMPPRHGKSELASRRFPAWYMGNNPGKNVIAASYNSDLANDFGREVRNIVREDEYRALFPDVQLAQDSTAANRWHTNSGGGYIAAGVGTATTGRGADVFLIDDPVKDREAADSETTRDKIWAWYRSTAYTRLAPGGAIVLIQTRWHEDDLAGRLLEEEAKGGDQWRKLILPAIDPNGDALWGERYPIPSLERIKRAIGPRDWSALYQQQPSPDEGTFFQRDWFSRHDTLPQGLNLYGFSDYAVTDGGGDYTEHGVFGIDPAGKIYMVDWWSGQASADTWIESKIDLIARYRPLCWFGEAGVIQKAVEPMLTRRMRERKVFCRLEWVSSIHDKATRARGFQARAAMGGVSLLADERGENVLSQLLTFPAGKFDDKVDVCGLVGRVLDDAHPGVVSRPSTPVKRDRYERSHKSESGNWKTA